MPSFTTGTVSSLLSEREGLQRVEVDGRRAYVLTALIGTVAVGDRVVVNTTAFDLGLGTGGWDVVHWNLSRESLSTPGGGHVMKLRYTSLQADTGVAEDADDYDPPADLGRMPVIACALHSQLGPVAAAFRAAAPRKRLAYVMTDAGALPLALSDLVADLRAAGLVDLTVTAGQAFGGDLEAVNVASALQVALTAGADAVVVGTGPGVVGTGTRYGYSGLEVASLIDTTARSAGLPIVAVRWSDTDERPRHQGVSHHTITALERAYAGALVPVPKGASPPPFPGNHSTIEVDVPDVGKLLAAAGIELTTMGRSAAEDPGFLAWSGAAGAAAAGLV